MKHVSRYKPSPAMAVAILAFIVAAGGVAFAAIPDSAGVIHACYAKSNGSLRAVDSAANCKRAEKAIAWNQRGPQGEPGPPGTTVVARARGTTPETATGPDLIDFPLNDNTWTQQAGETDLILGHVSVTPPAHCASFFADGVIVRISVDGKEVGNTDLITPTGDPDENIGVSYIFEPAANMNRTVTAQIQDDCTDQHFTVNSVKVNVFGMK